MSGVALSAKQIVYEQHTKLTFMNFTISHTTNETAGCKVNLILEYCCLHQTKDHTFLIHLVELFWATETYSFKQCDIFQISINLISDTERVITNN
jgi:hypothetical protein